MTDGRTRGVAGCLCVVAACGSVALLTGGVAAQVLGFAAVVSLPMAAIACGLKARREGAAWLGFWVVTSATLFIACLSALVAFALWTHRFRPEIGGGPY